MTTNNLDNNSVEVILFFSGTFDPIHYGHVQILKQTINYVNPDKILISIDNIIPWKNQALVSPYSFRKEMVTMFLHEQKINYELCELGINCSSSYATICNVKKAYPKAKIFFLIGQDQYTHLTEWYNYKLLVNLVTFVCYPRIFAGKINRINQKDIILDSKVISNISSAYIRNNLDSANISKYINQDVYDYILKNHLYMHCIIKNKLNEYRYNHTIRVTETIYKIATGNHFTDYEIFQCYLAACLHDIAKLHTEPELKTFLTEQEIKYLPTIHCGHGIVGAKIAESEFKINDYQVIDAIRSHVIYTDNDNKIAKALFCADKLEPARTEQDISNRKELLNLCCNDLDKAFNIVFYKNKEKYK